MAGSHPLNIDEALAMASGPQAGSARAADSASTAFYHAEVAAKHAASLAQWVQYLSGTLTALQFKVADLEDWKRQAREETRRLREEHKVLKQQVLNSERLASDEVSPAVSSSAEDDSVQGASMSSSPLFVYESPLAGEDPNPLNKKSFDPVLRKMSTMESESTTTPLSPVPLSPLARFGDLDLAAKEEGLYITSEVACGIEKWRVEWRILKLSDKLRGCMGRALVSSPFDACGLRDLRLMICPDSKESSLGPRNRKDKELYNKKITAGPLEGCLRLKIPNCPSACELVFYLSVGTLRRGPFRHDFSHSAVSDCGDFGDWLLQLAPSDRSLTVAVELEQSSPDLAPPENAEVTP